MDDEDTLLHSEDDAEYLRQLSARLMHVPATFMIDGYDCDRLNRISRRVVTRDDDDLEDLL